MCKECHQKANERLEQAALDHMRGQLKKLEDNQGMIPIPVIEKICKGFNKSAKFYHGDARNADNSDIPPYDREAYKRSRLRAFFAPDGKVNIIQGEELDTDP